MNTQQTAQEWWEYEVAIDRWGDVYHDPSNLACTRDMTVCTVGDAQQNGYTAHPCTGCFGLNGIVPRIDAFCPPSTTNATMNTEDNE